jgi:hypothetical protein
LIPLSHIDGFCNERLEEYDFISACDPEQAKVEQFIGGCPEKVLTMNLPRSAWIKVFSSQY